MFWLLLAIAAVFLAIRFRRFRYILLAIMGLLVLLLALFIFSMKANEAASMRRVRADQLVFTDLRMEIPRFSSSQLTGRIKNNSKYRVSYVRAKFRVFDCDAQSHCDIVGEEESSIVFREVPPGQVRDIDTSIYFGSSLKIRGRFQWDYQITEIRADK
jgi:hypothetical protein